MSEQPRSASAVAAPDPGRPRALPPSRPERLSLRRLLFGPPRDVQDPRTHHHLSLIALLAWVGLGADGLSSSAYGPDETFRNLGEHRGLAIFLAAAMVATVFIISYGYSRIIE